MKTGCECHISHDTLRHYWALHHLIRHFLSFSISQDLMLGLFVNSIRSVSVSTWWSCSWFPSHLMPFVCGLLPIQQRCYLQLLGGMLGVWASDGISWCRTRYPNMIPRYDFLICLWERFWAENFFFRRCCLKDVAPLNFDISCWKWSCTLSDMP